MSLFFSHGDAIVLLHLRPHWQITRLPSCIVARSGFTASAIYTNRRSSFNFSAAREAIIRDLQENTNDKSLAKKVDKRVLPLVSWINREGDASDSFGSYVTTSSCSGRILLFHRCDVRGVPRRAKRGSLGKGKLVEWHDPVADVEHAVHTRIIPAIQSLAEVICRREEQETDDYPFSCSELLHLQFRPMILHILAKDAGSAALLLKCARESGQNASGVLSLSHACSEDEHGEVKMLSSALGKLTCCITSSLAIDVPLYANGRWLLSIPPSKDFGKRSVSSTNPESERGGTCIDQEWECLLANTILHANDLFTINFQRMNRFLAEMKRRM